MNQKPEQHFQSLSSKLTELTSFVQPLSARDPAFRVLNGSLFRRFKSTEIEQSAALYRDIQSLLIETQDSLNGIVTKVNDNADRSKYPTGRSIVRDASQALDFDKRLPPDSALVNSNNLLLRALGMVRGIDHALTGSADKERLKLKFEALLHQVIHLQKSVERDANMAHTTAERNQEANAKLREFEQYFNTELAIFLNEANLAEGLTRPDQFSELLLHYRYLATLIDPAPSVVTQNYDAQNKVTHVETSFPITMKSRVQVQKLRVMKEQGAAQRGLENYHNVQNRAIQKANAAFADLAVLDDRTFAAQARKNIAPTVKNGYIVRNEIIFDNKPPVTDWSARSATLVYMGKGENEQSIAAHAEQNIVQVEMNLVQLKTLYPNDTNLDPEMKVHPTILATYSPIENQYLIVNHTERAALRNGTQSSYVPTNWDGTNRFNNIAQSIREVVTSARNSVVQTITSRFGDLSVLSKPSDKKARLMQAAVLGALVNVGKSFINLFTCASGQDRTGTAQEAATEFKTVAVYAENNVPLSLEQIQALRMKGGNAAFIASSLVPGSYGMKKDSIPGGFFDKETTRHNYLSSASTNKVAPLNSLELKKTINNPAAIARWYGIHPEGKILLNSIDAYLEKLRQRGRWNPFMKGANEKAQVMMDLRERLVAALSDNTFDAGKLLRAIEQWEGSCYAKVVNGITEYHSTRVIIARHRNLFFEESRYNQDRDRSEQTETQKFILDLKQSLQVTRQLDAGL